MAILRTEVYNGHKIDYWAKSFRVDDGTVLLLPPDGERGVRRAIDAIDERTRQQIRDALGLGF